jgi:hypothetical protein
MTVYWCRPNVIGKKVLNRYERAQWVIFYILRFISCGLSLPAELRKEAFVIQKYYS